MALDGTKLKANASKHKEMSNERMTQDTARLEAEVAKLMQEAEQVDAAEDQECMLRAILTAQSGAS